MANLFKLSILYGIAPHLLYDELYSSLSREMQSPDLFAHPEPIDSNSKDEHDLTDFF